MRNGKASPPVKDSDAPPTAPSTYGRGGIEKLRSGRFRVTLTVDGVRVRETVDTLDDAEAMRRAMVQERHERDCKRAAEPPVAQEVCTLASWGATWLKRRRNSRAVRWPADDEARWRRHIASTPLVAMPLVDVRAKHVREWVASLASARSSRGGLLSAQTLRHALNLVHKALGDAVIEELIASNPSTGVKVPKRHDIAAGDAWTFLTADEVRAVERCEDIPEALRLLFVVAIYTGLRAGELWALRWGDVREGDARPEVVVRASHKSAPKNGRVQSVPMLQQARAAFARLRALATLDGEKLAPEALVFPAARGGQRRRDDDAGWSSRKVRGKPWRGYRERAGIARRVRFHDLRHTCASHLVMGSWTSTPLTLAEARSFLRHGSVTMTERYAHLAPGHLHDRIATTGANVAASASTGDTPDTAAHAVSAPVQSVDTRATTDHPKPSADRPEGASAEALVSVGFATLAGASVSTHAETSDPSKPLLFRAPPTGLEPVTFGLGRRPSIAGIPGENAGRGSSVGDSRSFAALHNAALDLLRAVDDGHPIGAPARALAVEVLRSTAPDSPPWHLAVTVLEGGPLRARNAVELAGRVLDALDVEAVGEAAG